MIMGRKESLYETAVRLAREHTVSGILTAPAQPEYRRKEQDFERLAADLGCPFRLIRRWGSTETDFVRNLAPEIGVSLNWPYILGSSVLALFPRGILNAHFGDLPRYRGNAVANWAIIRREPRIVLTVHFMTGGELDSGPILAQKALGLGEATTITEVMDFERSETPVLFSEALRDLEKGEARPIPQESLGKVTFRCYPRLPEYSKIEWRDSAEDIDALVRASTHPYSGAYTFHKTNGSIRKLFVWASRVVTADTNDLGFPGHILRNDQASGESWVMTGRGILALRRVQYPASTEFEPGRQWKSIRMRLGVDWEEEMVALSARLSNGPSNPAPQ